MTDSSKIRVELPRVVFLCIENSCRSQMAEAFARKYGANILVAESAGTRASGSVNPKAIDSMQRVGIDISSHRSKSLSDLAIGEVAYAITMGCGAECPSLFAKYHEDWGLPDPKSMGEQEFDQVRDEIERRVQALILRIERAATSAPDQCT